MSALLIGYARVSTDGQDLTAQREALTVLGVTPERIYFDHGLTGTNRERPGLREALAACRDGGGTACGRRVHAGRAGRAVQGRPLHRLPGSAPRARPQRLHPHGQLPAARRPYFLTISPTGHTPVGLTLPGCARRLIERPPSRSRFGVRDGSRNTRCAQSGYASLGRGRLPLDERTRRPYSHGRRREQDEWSTTKARPSTSLGPSRA
jgi:Resolvase, N terminal domain